MPIELRIYPYCNHEGVRSLDAPHLPDAIKEQPADGQAARTRTCDLIIALKGRGAAVGPAVRAMRVLTHATVPELMGK